MDIATRLKRAAKELLGRRQWPKPEQPRPHSYEDQLYASVVRRGDVCFDVGAHVGNVSVLLARLAGESGRVVAFEPVWPVYVKLCRNVQRDTYQKAPILPIPAGLADAERDASIQVPGDRFGRGSLAPAEDWSKIQSVSTPDPTIVSYQCRFVTLDSFLASTLQPAPDFVKIDVEGAELLVLHGAKGTFEGDARPAMLIEIYAPWEQAFGYQPWEPLSWLLERGYRFLFACPQGLVEHVPSASTPFPAEYENGYNVLALVPDKHADRLRSLNRLRAGTGAKILSMPLPPRPNRAAPA